MKRFQRIFISVLILAAASPSFSEETGSSWLRTRKVPNALNPDISLIGDFLGTANGNKNSGFSLREAELGLQSNVDPFTRADVFFAKHDGEEVELEEGYITLLALPLGFQARGGKFLANFGRLNMVHSHEKPQVDSPLVLDRFLGEEGLNSAGVEVSRIFAPLGLFTEVSYAFLNNLGEKEPEITTTTVNDAKGNPVVVAIHPEKDHVASKLRNFAHVSRVRFYGDLSDASNLELGFSGALRQIERSEFNRTGGVDITLRWKPLQQGLYHSFIWRTEALFTDRKLMQAVEPITGVVEDPQRKINRKGVYSYLEYQLARQWRMGARGDYLEEPEVRTRRAITRSASPYITYSPSEFNRIRLQYKNIKEWNEKEAEHIGYLQWTVVLGPHGAHPF